MYTRKQKTPLPKINYKLSKGSIAAQMVPSSFFHATKFESTWPFTDATDFNLGFEGQEGYEESDSSDEGTYSTDSSEDDDDGEGEDEMDHLDDIINEEMMQDRDGDEEDDSQGDRELHTNSWLDIDSAGGQ